MYNLFINRWTALFMALVCFFLSYLFVDLIMDFKDVIYTNVDVERLYEKHELYLDISVFCTVVLGLIFSYFAYSNDF